MVDTIDCDELKAKLDGGEDFTLVMTMHEHHYRAAHIPGSIRQAPTELDSLDLAPDREIVVYCSDPSCSASMKAAETLVRYGYTNVRHYVGGLSEWEAAGYPLEGQGIS